MTRIYGASDDLVEFDGDFRGECGAFGTDDSERGALVVLSDGSVLEVKYGKGDLAIWGISVLRQGTLFECISYCSDEDAEIHSDIAYFRNGIKWGYFATRWENIQ